MRHCNKEERKVKKGFLFIKKTIEFFYFKSEFIDVENIPDEASLIIGNHAQLHSPITTELHFPKKRYTWCIGQMMNKKEVPDYAYKDFWSLKPKWCKWFYKLLAHIIAPISEYVFTNADTIGVFHDSRLFTTFKQTVQKLNEGYNVIIFPECPTLHNEIINEFLDKFVDVAVLYYKKYGKCVNFVPMYNAPKIKKVIFGKPIQYNPNIDINEQRTMVCNYLKEEITRIAKSLPVHKVVPYNNIKKRNYPMSK